MYHHETASSTSIDSVGFVLSAQADTVAMIDRHALPERQMQAMIWGRKTGQTFSL